MAELTIPELGELQTRLTQLQESVKSIELLLEGVVPLIAPVERKWLSRPQFCKKEHMGNEKFQELVKTGKIECNDARGGIKGRRYCWKQIHLKDEEEPGK